MSAISLPISLLRSARNSRGDVRGGFRRLAAIARDRLVFAFTLDLCPRAAPVERFVRRPIVLLVVMLVMAILLSAFANPVSSTAACAIVVLIVVGHGWPAIVMRGITAELRFAVRRGVEGRSCRWS